MKRVFIYSVSQYRADSTDESHRRGTLACRPIVTWEDYGSGEFMDALPTKAFIAVYGIIIEGGDL